MTCLAASAVQSVSAEHVERGPRRCSWSSGRRAGNSSPGTRSTWSLARPGRRCGRSSPASSARCAAGSVMTLDFTGVGIIDFSCADECLAKLVTRLIAGEYGEKYLRLTGLGESQRENIHVALERKRLPALLVHPDGSWDCLGTITPHLRETLRLLVARRRMSARELVGLLDLELTASSTRLGSLHRLRLVQPARAAIGEGGQGVRLRGSRARRRRRERGGARWLRRRRCFPGRSSRSDSSAGSRSCGCCGARRARSCAAGAQPRPLRPAGVGQDRAAAAVARPALPRGGDLAVLVRLPARRGAIARRSARDFVAALALQALAFRRRDPSLLARPLPPAELAEGLRSTWGDGGALLAEALGGLESRAGGRRRSALGGAASRTASRPCTGTRVLCLLDDVGNLADRGRATAPGRRRRPPRRSRPCWRRSRTSAWCRGSSGAASASLVTFDRLAPLSLEAASRLARHLARTAGLELAERAIAALAGESAGSPFYLGALVRALADGPGTGAARRRARGGRRGGVRGRAGAVLGRAARARHPRAAHPGDRPGDPDLLPARRGGEPRTPGGSPR